ncbi:MULTISPECIES: beta-ketoacyl-ACP synthase III [unclassified Paenibacillus]|uniref:beta-ketoacyl-ACP synthase III n=1 Tax=unclassified Paenibacillus TaxID=185978 RepID=UPI001AE6D511|nr:MULTISPECIES: beta-ketoacyl-ACP synthase III [unclassified Paenibacillus]MBP1156979.1 3-oxoacyl-[acyl-carrier-protein] synthase-3 [Paenibacillus sp. PvP091]MBP1172282.1 3-oxoacyl-[acyl-carrier-protein] synthase-3 [Paenibacillus sp. PvR098]MBP2438663.1 3-oxoacyl-[acyl-carrier-protein] synthase-3 [Paenibacillus sp. PvP052]
MSRAIISGVGSYVPEKILTNSELEKLVDTSDEWILERTGISERRIALPGQATSDLAYFAAEAAIQDAGLLASDIDLIIVATETPDHPFPPVACQVQHRLGCRSIAAFDVHLACTGFIAALHVAEKFIKSNSCKHALVVGADTLSRITDYTDRSTCILFSDGAGAFVLSASEESSSEGIIHSAIHSNGEYFDAAIVPGGGSRHPQPHSEETKYKILMNGNRIFRLAVTLMSQSIKETLEHSGFTLDQVDWVIPHQANQRIIDAVGRTLEVPHEKMISTIRYYGNNSAATVPLAMDHSIRAGKIKHGDVVALTAFGGGLGWGSLLLKY